MDFDLMNNSSDTIVFWVAYLERQRGSGNCGERRTSNEVIEPGKMLHVHLQASETCKKSKLKRVSAVFSDATWVGQWSDLQGHAKSLTIGRLVYSRWLPTLNALRKAENPVAMTRDLMQRAERDAPKTLSLNDTGGVATEEYSRKVLFSRALWYLNGRAQHLYESLRRVDPNSPDAKSELDKRIVWEIRFVEDWLERTAWVTVFDINGNRTGSIPPPPSRRIEEYPGGLKKRPGG